MNKPQIKIEVVSDVVCPWCYIGKRRLEKALDQLKDQFDFDVEYSPFELNPDMPLEGRNQKEYLMQKFGGETKYAQITSHVTKVAAEEGLNFDFTSQHISPNTRSAHRIIWFAKSKGKQLEIKEALMKAYFEKGVDLSKKENLALVASEVGLSSKEVIALLESEEGLAEVVFAEQGNYQRGVTGVPFYVINDKYGISGAQPVEAFIEALTNIGTEITSRQLCDVDKADC
jgi:predicted DsbA family dithiol-disulfide isomerase